MIQEKTFRKDLFYRLSTLPLSIPPLCERKGDIPLLIHAIQRTLGSSFTLTDEAMEVFLNHPYPGNVRELYNYLEYLSCLGEGSIITYSALPVLLKKSWEQHRSDSSSYVTMDSAPQTTAFFRAAGIHAEEFLFLLGQLAEASKVMRGMGRGSLKAYLLFAIEGIKQLLEQRKPLAVILERPRGCDDIAKLINNGAVVLEF